MASEAEHLVEFDFGGPDVRTEEAGDGGRVKLLGIADDDGHEWAAFDVFVVERAEIVEGKTTYLLGELGTAVAVPVHHFSPIADVGRQ